MAGFILRNPKDTRASGTNLLVAGESFNFITQSMKKKFLDSFEKDLDTNPLYLFYGQSSEWNSSPTGINIDSPPKPTNAFRDNISVRANMIGLKRVNANDTRAAFRKVTWKSGTVYNQYDTEVDQSISPNFNYYVIQDNSDVDNYGYVYKCLDNNNGAISKFKPFQYIDEQIEPVTLADGYKWKYMFTVPGSDLSRFNTNQSPNDDYVPIIEDTSYKSARGTIDRIDINSPGINYKPSLSGSKYYNVYDTPVVPLFIESDGDIIDSAQVFVENVNTATGAITALRGAGEGQGGIEYGARQDRYTVLGDRKLNRYVPVKLIEDLTDLDGTSIEAISKVNRKFAYGIAKVGDTGLIDSPGAIKIISGGDSYISGTKVRVIQSTTIAYGDRFNSNGGITKIKVISSGQNHTLGSVVPIHASPGPKGFIGKPIISPILGHGADPKLELNSRAIFVNTRVTSVDQSGQVSQNLDFPAVNDFRQVGLIQNVAKFGSSLPNDYFLDATARASHVMTVTDVNDQIKTQQASAISTDLLLTGNITRAQGRVLDIFGDDNSTIKTIRYIQVGRIPFRQGENLLFKGVQAESGIQITDVKGPEVDVYTGDILFINNNNKIERSKNQTETINFLIQF
jgi:hypothetical protein